MVTKEEIYARLDQIKEAWAGLDRNPSDATVASNDKLRDIWKKTLSMSHDEYLAKVKRGFDSRGQSNKAIDAVIVQRGHDSDADDANQAKMKKGLKDGSLAPKQNAYQ